MIIYMKEAIRLDLSPFSCTPTIADWNNRAIKRENIGIRTKASGSYLDNKELAEALNSDRKDKILISSAIREEQSSKTQVKKLKVKLDDEISFFYNDYWCFFLLYFCGFIYKESNRDLYMTIRIRVYHHHLMIWLIIWWLILNLTLL